MIQHNYIIFLQKISCVSDKYTRTLSYIKMKFSSILFRKGNT